MATTVTSPTKLWISQFQNLLSDTIKCALIKSTWTYVQDTHFEWADCSAHETSGTGYAAGGATLGSKVLEVYDAANNKSRFTAGNASWSGLSSIQFQYAVVYNSSAVTKLIYAVVNYGATQTISGDYQIAWDGTLGIINNTTA